MPYIKQTYRDRLEPALQNLIKELAGHNLLISGVITYLITRLILNYLGPRPTYESIAVAVGILETAKLELYRKLGAPYENSKIDENGDVY